MINSEIYSLIALGIAIIFGLQGALKLAINHYTSELSKNRTSCNKILISKEAFFIKIQIICFGCLRIYFANILMGASIIAYHFF